MMYNIIDEVSSERIEKDIGADDFEYYLSSNHDANDAKILERYKNFNGLENNSPLGGNGSFTASSTNSPDTEDLNDDKYINTEENGPCLDIGR